MKKRYTHELETEVRSISGGYVLEEEGILELENRNILYVIGNAMVDSACCGTYGCRFALVPGFVLRWKHEKNESGFDISEVEPIRDSRARTEIETRLSAVQGVTQVVFW
jgi:hypothetical protein